MKPDILIKRYVKYMILVILIYMPVFGFLDTLPIRIWDEARLAINAIEMNLNNNFIVTYYNGNPDLWNTKPPLMIILQTIFMKFIGVNEFSVRLPSALAALFTISSLLVFSRYYLKNFWFGFITICILITTQGYINTHAVRTGDYDALLTFFTTISALLIFIFIETKKNKFLYLFFITLALAVLTKSIAGLLFTPAILIFIIIRKQLFQLLRNKHFYYGLSIFTFLILGYYFSREILNPGYLSAVFKNELGGRFLEVVENHSEDFWYYYTSNLDYKLSSWYLLVPLGILIGLLMKDRRIFLVTLFTTILVTTFFFIITFSETKLGWYDVPIYPFLSIIIAIPVYFVFKFLIDNEWLKRQLTFNVFPFLFLFIVFINPYQDIIYKTYKPIENLKDSHIYELSYFLQDAVEGKYDLNNTYIIDKGYNAHHLFYVKMLNDKGINISFNKYEKLQVGDTIIVSNNVLKQKVEELYEVEIIDKINNILIYRINGEK